MSKRQIKLLTKKRIRYLAAHLERLALAGVVSSMTVDEVQSICYMAKEFVTYRRTVKKYGKRRRDSGMGLKKILVTKEQEVMWLYLESCAADGSVGNGNIQAVKDFLMYDILIHTGLRVSELCNLQVRHTPYILGDNHIEVYRGKNDKDRDVPISARLAGKITDYILLKRPGTVPIDVRRNDIFRPLFYSKFGTKYSRRGIGDKFGTLGTRAGIAKVIHPHMFRHTAITNWLRDGTDIKTAAMMAGHSSIKITERYVHIAELLKSGLGDKLDMYFQRQK